MVRQAKKLSVSLDPEVDKKVELAAKKETEKRKKKNLPRACVSKSEWIGNLIVEHFS